jgi:hypothetical protein
MYTSATKIIAFFGIYFSYTCKFIVDSMGTQKKVNNTANPVLSILGKVLNSNQRRPNKRVYSP